MVADSTGRSAVLEWVGADADHDADGSQRQLNVLWNDTDAPVSYTHLRYHW